MQREQLLPFVLGTSLNLLAEDVIRAQLISLLHDRDDNIGT